MKYELCDKTYSRSEKYIDRGIGNRVYALSVVICTLFNRDMKQTDV